MCLERVRQKAPREAKRDIVCYKLLCKSFDGRYFTPFQWCRVSFNNPIRSSLEIIKSNKRINMGIHTLGKLEEAQVESADTWYTKLNGNNRNEYPVVIVKAVIPKGSLYWTGKFIGQGTLYLSYCSNQIIYLKEI